MTISANPIPPERPATRRLDAALVRLEAAAAQNAARAGAARALEVAAADALAELDTMLERHRG